jgi:hypothetical protein
MGQRASHPQARFCRLLQVLLFVGRQTAVGPRRVPADGFCRPPGLLTIRPLSGPPRTANSRSDPQSMARSIRVSCGPGVELEAARVRLQDAANRLAKVLVSEGPRVLLVDALSQLHLRIGALSLEEVLADGQEPWAARYAAPS